MPEPLHTDWQSHWNSGVALNDSGWDSKWKLTLQISQGYIYSQGPNTDTSCPLLQVIFIHFHGHDRLTLTWTCALTMQGKEMQHTEYWPPENVSCSSFLPSGCNALCPDFLNYWPRRKMQIGKVRTHHLHKRSGSLTKTSALELRTQEGSQVTGWVKQCKWFTHLGMQSTVISIGFSTSHVLAAILKHKADVTHLLHCHMSL